MSRAYFYQCDGCGKPVGDNPHITLEIDVGGIAVPPNSKWSVSTKWVVIERISNEVLQFHGGTCIAKFFDEKIRAATKKS